jgi:hypothetical protein
MKVYRDHVHRRLAYRDAIRCALAPRVRTGEQIGAFAADPRRLLAGVGLTPDPWQEPVLASEYPAALPCVRPVGKTEVAGR